MAATRGGTRQSIHPFFGLVPFGAKISLQIAPKPPEREWAHHRLIQQERFMTVRPRVVRRAHLYEVGLGEGDAVGGAHRAAEQFGGGGRGGGAGR